MSNRRLCSFLGFMGLACTAGPEPPYYSGEAFQLNVRVLDPAPDATKLALELDLIVECHPTSFIEDADDDVPRLAVVGGSAAVPLGASAAHVRVAMGGGTGPVSLVPAGGQRCHNNRGQVQGSPADARAPFRYYRPTGVLLSPPPGGGNLRSLGPWLPVDREIVYARWPMRFAPFGPAGGVLPLPAGYSIVRRACGPAGGPMELVREPLERVIELRGSGVAVRPPGPREPLPLEPEAREFAQRCGITLPTVDPGTRVSLDAARRIAWSPDQSQLYYLSGGPEASRLRTIPAEGGAVVELLHTPLGERLDVTSGGEVFVEEAHGFLRRGTPSSGSMQFETLPIASEAFAPSPRVSPDGRWIADPRFPDRATSSEISIWDVAGKAERTRLMGALGGWAPDSQRLWFRPFRGGQGPVLSTWDVATGAVSDLGTGHSVEWLADGVVGLVTFIRPNEHEVVTVGANGGGRRFPFASVPGFHAWVDNRLIGISATLWGDSRDVFSFIPLGGVELQDPAAGTRSPTVPAIESPDLTQIVAIDGGVLIWTRVCHDLHHALCFFQLHRIALPAGTDEIVAVFKDRPVSALSPDRRRLAIATSHGIFVKQLP